ncbi:eCIS core domain-containing protein [Chitinophaga arvensicola]|uniref:eCIS core domain-containing protein n=1 Tax=Chitinophaga arvensicola TaxID=29529 RepID=A0A1I0S6X9_9BACT|nr:DUF4157 domain-containing protein [Chitinophaga arvensicola]SEW51374.1 protein of unknown function [Chitinophaga arvensicola]
MKTVTPRTATAAPHRAGQPFFNKGKGGFFSNEKSTGSFFPGQPVVQTKLSVGEPGDHYEKEADATADKVVQRLAQPAPATPVEGSPLQRKSPAIQLKCAACEHEEQEQKEEQSEKKKPGLQRKPIFDTGGPSEIRLQPAGSGGAAVAAPAVEAGISSSKGKGQSMARDVRQDMEGAFGKSFENVQIHTGSHAAGLNNSLQARAFTHGNDIYFNQREYNPGSDSGKHLLAHELTHVLQQNTLTPAAMPQMVQREGLLSSVVSTVAGGLGDLADLLGIKIPESPLEAAEMILDAASGTAAQVVISTIPGLPAALLMLKGFVATVKMIQEVIAHKEQILAEIKAFIEQKIDAIGPAVQKYFFSLPFADRRHLEIIWDDYLKPMLSHLKDNWWETIKETVHDQLYPFEGITTAFETDPKNQKGLGKEIATLMKDAKLAIHELKELNVGKFTDQFLYVQKDLLSIANRFYGWVAIVIVASETVMGLVGGAAAGGVGAAPGAAAGFGAGLATAGSIGEGLLAATIGTELLVILKSVLSLNSIEACAKDGALAAENDNYYKRIAEGSISTAMMLALLALAWVGGKIAGAILKQVVSWLPKDLQMLIARYLRYIEMGAKGEVKNGKIKGETETPGAKGEAPKIEAEGNSIDGKRKVQVDENGKCLVCASPCDDIRLKYDKEIKLDNRMRGGTPDAFETRLRNIEARADLTEQQKLALYENVEQEIANFRQRFKDLAIEDGKVGPKKDAEASAVLQAEQTGRLKGRARRPDTDNGEAPHDFAMVDEKNKLINYVEIKTPVEPTLPNGKTYGVDLQAKDIGLKIQKYTRDVEVVVDVGNLTPAEKATFLKELDAIMKGPPSPIPDGTKRVIIINN